MKREGIVAAALLGWALAAQPVAAQDPVAPIDGACDESSRNGCAAGTANDGAFPDYPTVYVWRCDGLHGGQNSQKCIKFVAVDGVCDESVRNGCAAGRPNDDAFPDHPTIHVWRCDGLHGGQNSEKCVRRPDEPGDGWSAWSACSSSACGISGKQTRTCTDPPAGQRNCLRLDGTRGSDEVRPCTGATPENGGWSDWGACSATSCGAAGTQTRTCNNPVPGCGGSECTGPSTRACTGATPVDGGWSAWSQCSANDCNTGGTRTRSCTNPAPACGGQDCTGDSSQPCTGGGASNGVWETGAWSQWTACDGSACTQSRGRSVTCSPPACGGAPCDPATKPAAAETRACPNRAWQTGVWRPGPCSETACGAAGTQIWTRTVYCPCTNGCTGTKPASSKTLTCTGNAPRHGVWRTDEWGPWTACSSSTCKQSRRRTVSCAAPGCGGNPCDENAKPSTEQTQSCSNPPSPQWTSGEWGPWSQCSASACGARGNQTRTREVSCSCGSSACPDDTMPPERETQGCTGNNPLNGACGTQVNSCSAGTYKNAANTRPYFKWRCEGACGGSNADCQLPRGCSATRLAWDGGCSANASRASSGSSVTLTTTGSCRSGSATFACSTGSWGSATSATCTVTPATNGSCNNAVTNGCTAGTLQDVADTTALAKWNCVGSCGGTTAGCSKSKLTPLSVSISVTGSSGRATATATVSGGTPPYTYSWAVVGAGSPQGSGRSITFSYSSSAVPSAVDVEVTVTDSAGRLGSGSTTWSTPPGGRPPR